MLKTSRFSSIGTAVTLALVAACSSEAKNEPPTNDSPLLHPTAEMLSERAPDTVRVRFETSKGPFVVEAYRDWAPNGFNNAHLASLATYYDCVPGFEKVLAENDGDLPRFYAAVRELSRRPRAERHELLCHGETASAK